MAINPYVNPNTGKRFGMPPMSALINPMESEFHDLSHRTRSDVYSQRVYGFWGLIGKAFASLGTAVIAAPLFVLLTPMIMLTSLIKAVASIFAPDWLRAKSNNQPVSLLKDFDFAVEGNMALPVYLLVQATKFVFAPLVALYGVVKHIPTIVKSATLDIMSHPKTLKAFTLGLALGVSFALLIAFPPAGIAGVIGFGGQMAATLGMASLGVGTFSAVMGALTLAATMALGFMANMAAKCFRSLCCSRNEELLLNENREFNQPSHMTSSHASLMGNDSVGAGYSSYSQRVDVPAVENKKGCFSRKAAKNQPVDNTVYVQEKYFVNRV